MTIYSLDVLLSQFGTNPVLGLPGLPCSSDSKESGCNTEVGEGNGTPLQCSCLENPRDGGAWWAAIYGVAHRQTRLKQLSGSNTEVRSLGWKDPLEKEMVTHSSTLAWRIPWTEEPGGLQSMELQRVRHN